MSRYRAFVESDMDNNKYIVSYYNNPNRWNNNILPYNDPVCNMANWSEEIKYLNPTDDDISDEIKNISNLHGGVYIFLLKGVNLPFMENYILYVGRARFTSNQNLRKRAKEYFNDTRRLLIKNMFTKWKPYIYYRYYYETDNTRINQIEATLIRAIMPPLNEDIPNNIDIRPAVSAF